MDNIAAILQNCEVNGTAPKFVVQSDTYKTQKTSLFQQSYPARTVPVEYTCNGEEIFVVSDLHIAAGRNHVGVYKGTENFFADDSFYRFLKYAHSVKKTKNAILVINGDIFDFLRITDFPGKVKNIRITRKIKQTLKGKSTSKTPPTDEFIEKEYNEWQIELAKIGINKNRQQLEESISDKERKYGLGTDNFKTIYKFIKIKNGHPVFFKALGDWIQNGNRIIIVKGNHDIELNWLEIRNFLRLVIAQAMAVENKDVKDILTNKVLPGITFIDDSVVIDKDFYVEHGHRYDKFCMILDNPVLADNPAQINLPFGSFFNRYLLNRVELFYPFLDNVRPSGNVLPMLLKENFPLGLKVLFHHIPFLLKILLKNFRYFWYMFSKVIWFLLALLLPLGLVYFFNASAINKIPDDISFIEKTGGALSIMFEGAKSFLMLFLSYLLARIVSWFQLTEPSSLDKFARKRFEGTDYRISTMGHTHNPGEYSFKVDSKDRRFYNTGTWIPVIETSTAEVREDKTFTFLHLIRNGEGKLQPVENGSLQRWNDDAERAEPQILIERK